jgi:hypothetical protein
MKKVCIVWTVADIHSARVQAGLSCVTDREAGKFLRSINKVLEDRSVEFGWEIILNEISAQEWRTDG